MSETRNLLELWKAAEAGDDDIILGTVVRVEGSSYRKPGARMLLTKSGERSGMISGGCLEAEVSRKAWWLTESGPFVQSYGAFFDDDNPSPHGLGCGGTVHLLLERGNSAAMALTTIRESVVSRIHSAMLTVIASEHPAMPRASRIIARQAGEISSSLISLDPGSEGWRLLNAIAARALEDRRSEYVSLKIDEHEVEVFAEYVAPPQALIIFGAGDDTVPVVEFASGLGWHVTVADSRSHLATTARFPQADKVVALKSDAASALSLFPLQMKPDDAVIIMTHSYMQDRSLMRELLPQPLAYLGLLGPRLRSSRLIAEIAAEIGLNLDACIGKVHSPVGLDIGGDNPSAIALSIVAGVQAAVHHRSSRHADWDDAQIWHQPSSIARDVQNVFADDVSPTYKIGA
jgi:xanthine/CO dehydrogenase XdhC/CoxF family maturation factor